MKLTLLIIVILPLLFYGCSGMLDPDEPGTLVPKTVMEDPALPHIAINGTVLHCETYGDTSLVKEDIVVIFLHGGPGRDYRSLLKLNTLEEDGYYLVFFDQRGSGLSMRHDEKDISMDIYLEDLDKIIDLYANNPVKQVVLFGHGWGATYATAYINKNPDKVDGAILSEPFPFTGAHLETIKDDLFNFSLISDWYNDYVWSSLFISADSHERKDYQFLLKLKDSQPNLNEGVDNPRPVWRVGAVANKAINESLQDSDGKYNFDFTTNLHLFTKNIIFIRSTLNKVLDLEYHLKLLTYYPSTNLITILNVAHDLLWINPEAVLDAVRSYLEGIEPIH